jgi:hypothetical protein
MEPQDPVATVFPARELSHLILVGSLGTLSGLPCCGAELWFGGGPGRLWVTAADPLLWHGCGTARPGGATPVTSAAAVAWQFAASDPQRRERAALRVIAWSFFALAGYVMVEAVRALLGGAEAEHSPVGIALLALSVVVMPFLSLAHRRTGAPAHRPRAGFAQRGGGLEADAAVHLPVRGRARRAGAQQHARLVVGRPDRGTRTGRSGDQGGSRSAARGDVAGSRDGRRCGLDRGRGPAASRRQRGRVRRDPRSLHPG